MPKKPQVPPPQPPSQNLEGIRKGYVLQPGILQRLNLETSRLRNERLAQGNHKNLSDSDALNIVLDRCLPPLPY